MSYRRGTIRTGQCNGTTASAANFLINTFFSTAEYVNRQRTNRQFVADLYDVFFSRTPDVGGFNYWVGQIDTGARTRQDVVNAFYGSPEWANMVANVAAAGCYQ